MGAPAPAVAEWTRRAVAFKRRHGPESAAIIHLSPSCARACQLHQNLPTEAARRARVAGGLEDVAHGLELLRRARDSGAFDAGTWECSIKSPAAAAPRRRRAAPAAAPARRLAPRKRTVTSYAE